MAHDSLLMTPLLVIVGETASGKSALAMELAELFGGEIICADSRTVYKGMDKGTAKPTVKDRARIPHYLLDVVTPDQKFTVAEFKKQAEEAILDIHSRGKMPIMVGGTGLYIDSVIFDYKFSSPEQAAKRNPINPRHLLIPSDNINKLRDNTLVYGTRVERNQLEARIKARVEKMFDDGLEEEVRRLVANYGWATEALSAVGYKEFRLYFGNQQTLAEIKQLIILHTVQYAKKQRAWFKRNESIQWHSDPREIVDMVTTLLNKKQ